MVYNIGSNGKQTKMLVIGHRGAPLQAPENTLQSYKLALDMGVDIVEVDVQALPSGEVVVMHDHKVDRTTGGHGYLRDYSLEQLRSLPTPSGEPVPTLQEVFELVAGRAGLLIDIKAQSTAKQVVDIVNHYLGQGWSSQQIMVQSYYHDELLRVKHHASHIRTATLMVGMPVDYARYAADLKASSANVPYDVINAQYVNDAHARGLKMYAWGANDPEILEYLQSLGVDGAITDCADVIIKQLQTAQPSKEFVGV
jgi:glycerophosphoryl diester phosphodiesterase